MELLRASDLNGRINKAVVVVTDDGREVEIILDSYMLDSANKEHRITGRRTSDERGETFNNIREVRLVHGRHSWTPSEVQATIDLHKRHPVLGPTRDNGIEQLAGELGLSESQVRAAVDAVGTVDPSCARTAPQASKMLEELWKKASSGNGGTR